MSTPAATVQKLKQNDTVPFYRIAKDYRNDIVDKLVVYSGRDPEKVTSDLAVTAIKSCIGSRKDKLGIKIVAVPLVISREFGPTFLIPLSTREKAFTSLKALQGMVGARIAQQTA